MKIGFTGGGTGGHFYPLMAVAKGVAAMADERKIVALKMVYFADKPFSDRALFDTGLAFVKVPAGKFRRYFSLLNFTDFFKTLVGLVLALGKVYRQYPDVIFSKGGYVSFPVLLAARFLNIPVVIHESDSVPGRVNIWAGRFAKRVAISFPEAAGYFSSEKVALTGNPLRPEIMNPDLNLAHEYFGFRRDLPVVLVLGGSQGAKVINDTLLPVLPVLVEKVQIIHQTGEANFVEVEKMSHFLLEKSQYKERYKPKAFLNAEELRKAAGATVLVISRAGSVIFEIAQWKLPSIIIPITDSGGDHQRRNAFNYSRRGACVVIEEANLTSNLLASEIFRLLGNTEELRKMSVAASEFSRPDAAEKIASELLTIALSHEK